jgi:hypothetical protein
MLIDENHLTNQQAADANNLLDAKEVVIPRISSMPKALSDLEFLELCKKHDDVKSELLKSCDFEKCEFMMNQYFSHVFFA